MSHGKRVETNEANINRKFPWKSMEIFMYRDLGEEKRCTMGKGSRLKGPRLTGSFTGN